METGNKRKTIDELMSAVSGILPQRPAEEISRNLRAALGGVLDRMDLVTREEFEVQQAVLLRSREKLEQLEKLVADLEKKLVKK
jgi:BMFP domain-containing protein YqiC